MDLRSIFSKTGQGLLELKYKKHQLRENELRLLRLIDGKTDVAALIDKSLMEAISVTTSLSALVDGGYIKQATRHVAEVDPGDAITSPEAWPENLEVVKPTDQDSREGDSSGEVH